MNWLARFMSKHERPSELDDARTEHLRVIRRVSKALPDDTAVRAELRRAERAIRGQADG